MTKLYHISRGIAKSKDLPVYFDAIVLKETQKALYLYGQGTTETTKMGVCCKCGRPLTHPVSVLLGIGPECGKHFHDWDLIGGYNKENIERLTREVRNIKIDTWIPKTCVLEVLNTESIIEIPENHSMVSKARKSTSKEKKVASLIGERIKIAFPFDRETLTQVKTIKGRKYKGDSPDKHWTCPISSENIEALKGFGFECTKDLELKYTELNKTVEDIKETAGDIKIPGFKAELFPFQKKGVAFLEAKKGKAIIGDSMGLGKTIQALAYIQLHPELRPAVIVCKATAKFHWEKEIREKTTEKSIKVLSGRPKKEVEKITEKVIIINYDIFSNSFKTVGGKKQEQRYSGWADYIADLKPQILVLDECHFIKDNSRNRTKTIKNFAKNIPCVIPMSGTPILNKPIEMFNAIKLVNSNFMNWFDYTGKYCDRKNNGFGWDTSGSSNTEELHEKLKTIMIRRTKQEVIKDLPAKTKTFVPVEINQDAEYFKAQEDFIRWAKEALGTKKVQSMQKAEAITRITTLKRLAAEAKLGDSIIWVKEFLEESEGKIVLFAHHKTIIKELEQAFKGISVSIHGGTPNKDRGVAVEKFQNDPKIRVFIGNMKAAGDSITLTAAESVAFIELPWTPGELEQCEDRVYARMNDLHGAMIYLLLSKNTIDEYIAEILDTKQKVLDSVLDGKESSEEDLITEIMNRMAS